MTSTRITELERAIQRYGDDLYRLALLLTPDEESAAAVLTSAVRRMADSSAGIVNERALIAALLAALPPERASWRPRRRLPAWAQPPASHPETRLPAPRPAAQSLLAAIARLPRQQRLALGLTMLRSFDLAQAASLLGGDEPRAGQLVRDTLLALVPQATPDLPVADLDVEGAPAACQPTRLALALGGERVHTDPELRGHLALCSACRAVEQSWMRLGTTVENALRGALRDVLLPAGLAARLRAAIMPELAPAERAVRLSPRVRVALVALLVLGLIALLVLPRRPAPDRATSGTAAISTNPRDLVRRARDRLYAPPEGSGVWHGRWEIRWNFADGSFATLNGDQWIDTTSPRHRVQLVHQSGGGPYEFELADGQRALWYATTSSYGPSLYPLIFNRNNARVHVPLAPAEQREMLRARLRSGAWDLPAAYLRQAEAASELRTWGSQVAADGARIELVSFRGVSPLALPPDAPSATASSATILLTIDLSSGALREVRELVGAEGQEQTGRLTWRFVGGEWLTGTDAIGRAFDVAQAWTGAGQFDDREGIADTTLPLLGPDALGPLAKNVQYSGMSWMPVAAPAGANRAILIAFALDVPTAIIYTGEGRRLTIVTRLDQAAPSALPDSERVTLNGREFALQPASPQAYRATTAEPGGNGSEPIVTQVSALGYTRAELLDVLRTLGPPTLEAYRAQARLFVDRQPRDPAAFDALLNALAPRPPLGPGMARHFVEHSFMRHGPAGDPLPDPYHLPPYYGRPERLITDNWTRGEVASGTLEASAVTRDAAGKLYVRQYLSPTQVWYYDASVSWLNRSPPTQLALINLINQEQAAVLDLLACGGNRFAVLPDGTRVVTGQVVLDRGFDNRIDPCRNDRVNDLLMQQRSNSITADGPYLLDVADRPLTTWLYLGADGRPARIEFRAGTERDATLLESWELASDERVPAERVPADAFDATPPNALTVYDAIQPNPQPLRFPEPGLLTLTETVSMAWTPLWYLPPGRQARLDAIEATPTKASTLPPFFPSADPFDTALRLGLAVRFTYGLGEDQSSQPWRLYEGPADRFGTYLRTLPMPWRASDAIGVTIAGRAIDGWWVAMPGGERWLLVEIDGTLMAIEASTPQQQDTISRLRRLERPPG